MDGILRGMHYQAAPDEETKLVRCTRGAAHHVLVDLRPGSATRGQWTSAELNADNRHALYIPKGVAHGFLTLCDATEIYYQMSTDYVAERARGVRWDDPRFAIAWPLAPAVLSDKDRAHRDFDPAWHLGS